MPRLDLQVLGFPQAALDGRSVELALKRGLALLVYLAEARAPVSREVLADLLWPEADGEAARTRLRRTLHRVRGALGIEAIVGDRTSVRLAPELAVSVDAHAFEEAGDAGDFETAARHYRGEFLDGFVLDGCPGFEEWAFFRREALRSRLAQVLERLYETKMAADDPRAAATAATRLVALDPLSESAHQHLIRANIAAGDRGAAERQYEACAKLLADELGVEPDPLTQAALKDAAPAGATAPRTRYAESDGLHIAFQTFGDGPVDIVMAPGFVSHVERAWEEPRLRAFLDALAKTSRVIIFDRRGTGLSDRIGAAPTTEATAADISAVMDAAGSRKAVLFGASEGGPGCIRLAAEAPERIAGLVLYGSLAKGSRSDDFPHALSREQFDAWLKHIVGGWGGPVSMETFAPSLVGDRQVEQWWSGLLRTASSPGAVKAVLEALRDIDVRPLLPRITAPTLVLHRRGDRAVRFEAACEMAEQIPNARMVPLEGEDHWFWIGDQEPFWTAFLEFMETLPPSGRV
jgi:DNA-binding SARP family transcriptional activator/pimeloyl-ACP methyl ester carboxylesterase